MSEVWALESHGVQEEVKVEEQLPRAFPLHGPDEAQEQIEPLIVKDEESSEESYSSNSLDQFSEESLDKLEEVVKKIELMQRGQE